MSVFSVLTGPGIDVNDPTTVSHEGDLRSTKQELDTWATRIVVSPAFFIILDFSF